MAEDTPNHIDAYIMETAVANAALLGHIRHWDNLKGANDGTALWVTGITQQQATGMEIQSIPYKKLYYIKDNLLFVKGSLLPSKKMPSELLWSPLARLLTVSLPSENHNFFGIGSKVPVRIVPSITSRPPFGIFATTADAAKYIESAPAIRLENISWLGIDNSVLLLGTPLLPIKGHTYWKTGNMLLPAGFDLELPLLYDTVQQMLDPAGNHFILWQQNGAYILLDKHDVRPLSISSFRLTYPAQ